MLSWLTWKLAGRVLKGALPVIAVAFAVYSVYSLGFNKGEAEVEARWTKEKLALQLEKEELEREIEKNEARYRAKKTALEGDLAEAEAQHARNIAAIQSGFALRLQRSNDRSTQYERMSQAGAVERANLASHAAGLDRALEQGRQLVDELRSTLEQRDRQLRNIGQELLNTRELMNSAVDSPEEPAAT